MSFFLAGGWATWFVLFFGGLCLFVAARFALRAEARRLAIVRALSSATVFAMIAGCASCFMAVMGKTTTIPEMKNHPEFHLIVMQGLGEAVSPAVLGSVLLALSWLFVAVGTRRLNDRD
jgi:hypothetical protein